MAAASGAVAISVNPINHAAAEMAVSPEDSVSSAKATARRKNMKASGRAWPAFSTSIGKVSRPRALSRPATPWMFEACWLVRPTSVAKGMNWVRKKKSWKPQVK